MKFAHKHGAYYLTPGMNTDDFRTKEIELFGSNNIRFIPVASEQSSQLKGLVCIDDEIFITGYNVDVLNKLKENSILYGFNSLNVEYKPKEI